MNSRLQFFLLVAALLGFEFRIAGADLNRVRDLIPELANPEIADRFAAQMELQNIAANASRPGAEPARSALATLLSRQAMSPSVPRPARVWIIRQLEYIGGDESVDSLVRILNGDDSELRECARRALEKNSAPSASAGLRAALGSAAADGGDWTVGLIHALGERRDADAVPIIVPLLNRAELEAAAADALGRIANQPAVRALNRSARSGSHAAAIALITAGKMAVADGQPRRAANLFARLVDGEHSPGIRAAALAGLLKTGPDNADRLILQALRENDPRIQQAAVTAAARLDDNRIVPVVVDGFASLGAPAKTLALGLFDRDAEEAAIAAVGDPEPSVQIAALETLARIGTATAVSALIRAARTEPDPVAQSAVVALARIRGPGADQAIGARAAEGDPESRAIAIRALADRARKSSLPGIVDYAGAPDQSVRAAAFDALRRMGGAAEVADVLRLYTRTKSADALAALKAVAARSEDASMVVNPLRAAFSSASPDVATGLFDVLTVVGSDSALKLVSASALDPDSHHSDTAFRALCRWPNYSAAPSLLRAASQPDRTVTERILAVRGIVGLLKAAGAEPATERADLALATLDLAARPDEKRLVLSALATVPDARCAAVITRFLSDPVLRSEAGLAAVTLAPNLFKVDRDSARDLVGALRAADLSEEMNKRADALLKRN